jgi:2-dehydropantoate 2-reductase
MQLPAHHPLRVLAFGAGAIGTYVGGSLALAGHQVVFLESPAVAEELRGRGLRLDLSADQRRAQDAYTLASPACLFASSLEEALKYGPFDVGLFALKSFDTAGALEGMQPFAEKLPPVIYGTVTTAVGRRAAGDIVLERLRGVGVAAGHPLSESLVPVLDAAYLNCRLYDHALSMKWSKLLTNLLANPTSAILDMTAAQVFADRKLYRLEIAMLRECLAVMDAQGLKVVDLPGTPVRALAFAARLPVWLSKPFVARAAGAGRGGKMPSFHIDLHSGRGKSEVEYLHGAVVRAGERTGTPTPVNKILTETLLKLTRREIPLEEFAHQPGRLIKLLS